VPLSRAALGIAVALAALLIVGVVVLAKVLGSGTDAPASSPAATSAAPRTGPVALVPVDAPGAGSAACGSLISALPEALASGASTLHRLPLAAPAPPATAAWGDGGDPVVLRCGLNRPPELTPTAQLRSISGVDWLPIEGDRSTTWYLVQRSVYVALTVPSGTGTGVLQGVSEVAGRVVGMP
jgi:hypothetical protein